jgi:chromosome partitioning protein
MRDGMPEHRYGARVLLLAVGSPKGGVGKTTLAGSLAALAARTLKLRTLLVDADENRSALDWLGDDPDITVAPGLDYDALRRLRDAPTTQYDIAVIDLPGARAGAFEAILTGSDGRPVVDLLLVPTLLEVMDLRPVIRVVEREVVPLRLPAMIVLSRVPAEHHRRARERKAELRARGLTVADTVIRRRVAFDEAVEAGETVIDIPGRHHRAREAEEDMRQLAVEVFGRLGLDVRPLAPREL